MGGRDTIHPVKLCVTRTVSDDGDPELVLVIQSRADIVSYDLFDMFCHSLENIVRLWLKLFSCTSML